jgi:3-hydroxyisobutyrate dehydrogenase-like beta-hydroxyacid dehydrogenase
MSNSLQIGIIGLGNMGTPIAFNLLRAGFSLHVYNRSAGKANDLVAAGAKFCETPELLAQASDIVVTMVSDDAVLTEITDKLLPALRPGAIHLSMSTVSPVTSTQLATRHSERGQLYLSSPVMGRPPAAEARQLFVLLSGAAEAKVRVAPVLEAIGQRTFDFGTDVAVAHTVKVTLNFMIFSIVELLSEVMLMAEKTGINKSTLLDTITGTIFGAPVFKNYGNLVLQEQDNTNGFATRLALKDLKLAEDAAGRAGIQLPLAAIIHSHFESFIASGGGEKDVSLLISHLRKNL